MLNFYLLGVLLVDCIIIYDILFNKLIEKITNRYKGFSQKSIIVGTMLAVVALMIFSWITVIIRAHSYLMKQF